MRSLFGLMLACLAIPAAAQNALLTASPIPDGAETRFCYYAGLAYSRNAYLLIGGNDQVIQVSRGAEGLAGSDSGVLRSGGQVRSSAEQKPLKCVVGDDGVLNWAPIATLQIQ